MRVPCCFQLGKEKVKVQVHEHRKGQPLRVMEGDEGTAGLKGTDTHIYLQCTVDTLLLYYSVMVFFEGIIV